ncbi:bifunctional [glutamine synthetase] adenylyltransferase/[glutamine synthetase]-adenylyl-L-tyrosine phosphorylase [Rhodospirillaceae bacterium SYSU D60014]|uniref:bifunctional [glutamine synthetase] adenylyltransferase/[glutamine synthetase]-adenylyl-L-tyrosine phosphorylase n=1 Tax=Virgifigura deserti TaxID=2268457 RepID=UPI000E66C701
MLASFRPLDIRSLPKLGSPERAAVGMERWRESGRQTGDPELAASIAALAEDATSRALLEAVFGNSPFLTQCLLAEPQLAGSFLTHETDAVFADLLNQLRRDTESERDFNRLTQTLRVARRRAALLIALADIAGRWPLERVTAALSDFAETVLSAAAAYLLRRSAENGEIVLPHPEDPERGSGLIILAMGKLGAGELNYSSDIDLIVLYDRERIDYRGKRSLQDAFVRMARDLVHLLQDRTPAGYVFRTDLRLRPDPASTPLALSVLAAETYYEGMGQNWERAAMIKARAVAGDRQAGAQFLHRLRPFVWRKHLDFAAIQDIHSIKRQIHAVKGFRHIAVGGHNIKLGRGGIREIEFFAQTQQLIWGGRSPELRPAGTCEAIRALVAAGRVEERTAEEMIAAYRYLRQVEHRLQMTNDQQTQTLPPEGPELDTLARFVGHETTAAFTEELLGHLGRVEDHYAELFEEAPSLSGPGSLVFTGAENDPDTVRTLTQIGFTDGSSISAIIRGWHAGRYRATRSTRARELLTELMPTLLEALGRTSQPDAAFTKFDEFLAGLPAGVQLFSLLYANPALLGLLAEIMGGAPRLADHLSRNPALLEAVLAHGLSEPPPAAAELAKELQDILGQANDFQDVLDIVRRWTKDRQFQVGVRILRNIADADAAGPALSNIAQTALAALQPHVEAEFANRHGRLPGNGLVTVALGKLGGREMTVNSDLDLIFIYDAPDDPGLMSDGPKPLAPIHYYARLSQRLINAINAPTGEGRLFEVDMRLRPSGNAGPIASSLSGFRRYQEENAWTWEHMALTRARVVAGNPILAATVEAVLREVLTRPRDPAKLVQDVAAMRARMAGQHPTDRLWDVKHLRGGLVDVDFIAQYLQLRHAAAHPEILHPNTTDALASMAAAGLLDGKAADELIAAMRLWRRLQGLLRLTVGDRPAEEALPDALRQALAEAGGGADFADLKEKIMAAAATVRTQFETLIETPARAATI